MKLFKLDLPDLICLCLRQEASCQRDVQDPRSNGQERAGQSESYGKHFLGTPRRANGSKGMPK